MSEKVRQLERRFYTRELSPCPEGCPEAFIGVEKVIITAFVGDVPCYAISGKAWLVVKPDDAFEFKSEKELRQWKEKIVGER